MKTLKENIPAKTKDVLLHQIFQEISAENKEIPDDGYLDEIIPLPTTQLSKIRALQKKRQWFFIVLLVGAIFYVLFDTNSLKNVDKVEEKKLKKSLVEPIVMTKPTPVVHVEPKVPKPIELKIEKKPVPKKIKVKPKPPLTPREKAKALLRLQLEN